MLTALTVFVAVGIQAVVAAGAQDGYFHTPAARVFNVFCFFTVQSNVLVGVTCLLLAIRPQRSSTVFAVARLTGVVAITITAVVYHTALRDLRELHDWAWLADVLLHTVVPLLAIGGWLLFGPRRLTAWRTVWLSVVFPACWLAFTLVRGPITGFYPYPFVDVDAHGYPEVLRNCAVVALLFVAVAVAARVVDQRLDRMQRARPYPPAPVAGA